MRLTVADRALPTPSGRPPPTFVLEAGPLRAAGAKPGQERFVAPVAESLAEAYAEPEHAWPRLIYDGDTLVGFVVGGFHRTEPMFRSVPWRLVIAADHQGHGYGSFAVRAVAEEARRRATSGS